MAEIGHNEVKRFAAERVNLPKENADEYRAQVKRLRDRLTTKIDADPSFDLVKMLHSGSVAKGTALKTVNDLDVAVYVLKSLARGDEDLKVAPAIQQALDKGWLGKKSGKQFVAIAAGGGNKYNKIFTGKLVVFTLP